jgi:hypothetical protein
MTGASPSQESLLTLPRIAIDRGLPVRLAIRGGSMLPLLRDSMAIEVEGLREPARVGEILVFRYGCAYVAHRVLRRLGDRYVTTGDAQPEVVELVDAPDVLGRVRAVWSDGSSSAARVDTLAHRLHGLLLVRARPVRLFIRTIAGRLDRARRHA